ncbi:hypothetical protein CRG98_023785 [Punica granatum]|uniref:Uncharacterized protein n=1 Tax=Punica granatum TaxID=22663 RepID=A0A2I0JIT6_PUNGR|nr:hypothetical protein CRG98_023785 [Punica granatum]
MRKNAFGCADGCAQLREETCARSRDDAWLRGVSEKLALLRKVDWPSGQGSSCRGRRVEVAIGLPAKEVFTHLYVWRGSERAPSELPLRLWLADQFPIFLSSLPAKGPFYLGMGALNSKVSIPRDRAGFFLKPKRQSNCALYCYFESLSNMCFLISVVGHDPLVPRIRMMCNASAGNKCAETCKSYPKAGKVGTGCESIKDRLEKAGLGRWGPDRAVGLNWAAAGRTGQRLVGRWTRARLGWAQKSGLGRCNPNRAATCVGPERMS